MQIKITNEDQGLGQYANSIRVLEGNRVQFLISSKHAEPLVVFECLVSEDFLEAFLTTQGGLVALDD